MDRRLFIAVPLPPDVKRSIKNLYIPQLRNSSFRSLVHPDDYHITLFFLGATSEHASISIGQALRETAKTSPPFELSVDGTGTFGKPGSPSILWAGVNGEVDRLRSLQKAVAEQVSRIGFTPEERAYSPHISLARKWTSNEPYGGHIKGQDKPMHFEVTRIVLYQTHLNRKPSYEEVESYPLSSASS